jgi:ubiquilin
MMREGGVGGGAGAGGAGGFPAPGNPGGFPAPGTPGNAANPTNPASPAPAAQGMAPFASMFNPSAGGAPPAGGFDPAMLQQLFGLGAAAQNSFGGGNPFGAFGGAATPADTRPPEERFQVQLQVRVVCFVRGFSF